MDGPAAHEEPTQEQPTQDFHSPYVLLAVFRRITSKINAAIHLVVFSIFYAGFLLTSFDPRPKLWLTVNNNFDCTEDISCWYSLEKFANKS